MIAEPLPAVTEAPIDLSNLLVLTLDCINGKWMRVPIEPLQKALLAGQNILLVDITGHRQQLLPVFMLDDYIREVDDSDYRYLIITADDTNFIWKIDGYSEQLLQRFQWEWYNALKPVLYTDWFKRILATVRKARDTQDIWPRSEDMFTAFLKPLSSLKTVWLTPIPVLVDKPTGVGLSTTNKGLTPGQQVIENAIKTELDLGIMFNFDLSSLINQGLLSIPISFSSLPGHLSLWRPFITEVITILNQKPDLLWVTFGLEAEAISPLINPLHTKVCLKDPLYYSRSGEPTVTNGAFTLMNQKGFKF